MVGKTAPRGDSESMRMHAPQKTVLYERHQNFDICVSAITVVYALILPALRLVPSNLMATPDGKAP
jgi:hypothetical protein